MVGESRIRRGVAELADTGGRAGELFGAACEGVTQRVLACLRIAVEMPFSSTFAAAAGASQ